MLHITLSDRYGDFTEDGGREQGRKRGKCEVRGREGRGGKAGAAEARGEWREAGRAVRWPTSGLTSSRLCHALTWRGECGLCAVPVRKGLGRPDPLDTDKDSAADRAAFGMLVAGAGTDGLPGKGLLVLNGELAQETSGLVKALTLGRGKEAEGSDEVNAGDGDMAGEPGEELLCGELKELDAGPGFVLVAQEEVAGGFAGEAAVGDRAAADIAAEIPDDAAAMLVGRHDADMPLDSAELVEEVEALLGGEAVGEEQFAVLEGAAQEGEELAAVFGAEDAGRQEEALTGVEPLPVRGEAAAGDEEMEMGMNPEGLAPTVEGGDGAGQGAEMPGVGEEFPERVPAGLEQEMGKEGAVVFPQAVEFGGKGEDDMEVVTMDEAVDLGMDPPGDPDEGAQRTGAVSAGVIPDAFNMALGTLLHVAAE